MDKRYQVFVSSTYKDLEDERAEVMQALLELNCFPAGMELFPAASDTQWDWIKRIIDESDYYLVIIAGKYGTRHPETGTSFTEMEYQYAIKRGKPTIAFLHENLESLSSSKCEKDPADRDALSNFRKLAMKKLCRYYSSAQQLGAVVSRSITQLKDRYPANGWVKASLLENAPDPAELLDLQKKIEALSKENLRLRKAQEAKLLNLASDDDLFILSGFYTPPYNDGKELPSIPTAIEVKTTWTQMLMAMWKGAPAEITEDAAKFMLGRLVATLAPASGLKIEDALKGQIEARIGITRAAANEVLLQFRALGIMKCYRDSLGRDCYELTDTGLQQVLLAQAIKKESSQSDVPGEML